MTDPLSIPDDFDAPLPPPRAQAAPEAVLTYRQEEVWRMMLDYQDTHGGRPPTQGEISAALGLKAKQGCVPHFVTLSKLGFIVRVGRYGCWRAWLAVERPVPPSDPELVYGGNRGRHRRVGRPSADAIAFLPPTTPPQVVGGPTEAEGYTPRQIAVWHAFYRLQHEGGGVPPTQQQVSKAVGLTSVQGARAHYERLALGGYMKHKGRVWVAVTPLPVTETEF